MRSRLNSLFQIRPGEERLVMLLIGLFILPNVGLAVGSPGVEALFFSRFGVEFLPHMYIALGLVTMVVSLILAVLIGRASLKRLLISLPPVLAATLLISRLLVGMDLNWFYPILWLWMSLLGTLQGLLTWGLAGMVCDTRQAKRLFPLFGAGGILGVAAGGLITPPLVNLIGTENLLLVWAGLLIVTLGFVISLMRGAKEQPTPSRGSRPSLTEELQKGFQAVRQSLLFRWLAVSMVFFALMFFSVAFPFSKAAANQYPDEDALAGFLGIFQGLITTAAFIASLLLANRMYARYGFVVAILVLPLIYLVGFGAMFINASFVALSAFRFIQVGWIQGVAATAYQALFNIIPEDRREQTRTFVNGVPQQAGVILIGLLLVVGQDALQPRFFYGIGFAAAAATAFAMWRSGKAYRSALVDALQAGQPHMFISEVEPFGGFRQDAAAVETVVEGISHSDPGIRQVSATILGSMAVPETAGVLIDALEDSVPEVRVAMLKAIAQTGEASALLEVASCLSDAEAAVRLQAATTMAALSHFPRGVRSHLSPLLADPDPQVRAKVAVILLGYGEHNEASSLLHRMSADQGTEERIAALEAFSSWGDASGFAVAAAALEDTLPTVRRRAAIALARIDPERCRERLILALADDDLAVRETVASMLIESGPSVLPDAVAALEDATLEDGALLVLEALPVQRENAEILAYAERKVAAALRYDGLHHDLNYHIQTNKQLHLLEAALFDAARQHAIRAFKAVGLLGDAAAMAVTIDGLSSANVAQRANALEMLDSVANRDLVAPVTHLWESKQTPGSTEVIPSLVDTLVKVLRDPDDWIRACALFSSLGVDDPQLLEEISGLTGSASSLVSETAGYVLSGVDMETLSTIPTMQRILYLQQVPLFAELPPGEIKQIAAIAGEYLFTEGEMIANQGDLGDEMYIIVSGEVDVRVHTDEGGDASIAVRKPGEYVGEMSIISREPRMASLVAAGEVRALCVGKKQFEAMLRERPEISLAVMRGLIKRHLEDLRGEQSRVEEAEPL